MSAAPIPNPTSQADYYTDLPVGEILRRTRTHFGQSLDDAANYLRIRASQLEALEKNDISQLPGRVYAIGYIRTYSEYLGLDGEKMVHLFKQQSGGKTARPELHFPVPASESKAPNLYVIFGSLAVLALVIGVWIALSAAGHVRDKTIAEIPSVPAEMRSSPIQGPPMPTVAANTTSVATTNAAAPATAPGPSLETAVPAATATASTTPAAVAATTAVAQAQIAAATVAPAAAPAATVQVAATPAPAAEPTKTAAPVATTPAAPEVAATTTAKTAAAVAPATGPKKEVVMTIKDRSWVEVRDKQGKSLLSRILKPGEVFIIPESNYGLKLDTGNAGGIELTVNGLPVQPLGKQGDILRGFVLDGNELLKKVDTAAASTTPATKAQ